jgi:hypothetical protein
MVLLTTVLHFSKMFIGGLNWETTERKLFIPFACGVVLTACMQSRSRITSLNSAKSANVPLCGTALQADHVDSDS